MKIVETLIMANKNSTTKFSVSFSHHTAPIELLTSLCQAPFPAYFSLIHLYSEIEGHRLGKLSVVL